MPYSSPTYAYVDHPSSSPMLAAAGLSKHSSLVNHLTWPRVLVSPKRTTSTVKWTSPARSLPPPPQGPLRLA